MRSFEVGITGFIGHEWDGKLVIDAETRGEAKAAFLLRVADTSAGKMRGGNAGEKRGLMK